jgi:hypothetical protein
MQASQSTNSIVTPLLAALADAGVMLALKDGGTSLECDAPEGVLTPGLLAVIRGNKPAIIAALGGDAKIARHDTPTRPAGPLEYFAAEVVEPLPLHVGGLLTAPPAARHPPGACDRCGGISFRDTPIHDGASTRRDCAKCGRFISFPLWYGKNFSDAAAGTAGAAA